jgi:mono/diheme cytochrome c family protein
MAVATATFQLVPRFFDMPVTFFHLGSRCTRAAALLGCVGWSFAGAETDHVAEYQQFILPILQDHCFECHGDGEDKGKITFDTFDSADELMNQTDLWVHALKNLRSGMMPPPKKKRLSEEEFSTLENWIKASALKLDPQHPDPGRVTLRRLNRVEYRNTIRDLMGIDFRTDEEFPADDTGYGFDTIGDVLSTSSMLLEKYMQAAETIVAKAVPVESRPIPQRDIQAHYFNGEGAHDGQYTELSVSLYDPADIVAEVEIPQAGTYRVILNAVVRGSFAFDPGQADAEWFIDGSSRMQQRLKWEAGQKLESSVEVKWEPGKHPLRLTLKPLIGIDQKPAEKPGDGPPSVALKFSGATLVGPLEPEFAHKPKNYERFFPREVIPSDEQGRLEYAREILAKFTVRAFRRPVDGRTVDRLAALAMESAALPGASFERGISRAMTAVIASPRFLFRMEETLPEDDPLAHPLLDEWALASRLSYFLWSTMPDETLFQLAERGELRKNLPAQIERMIQDARSGELVRNFAGQWLQTRDVEGVSIDGAAVFARDSGNEKQNRERYRQWQQLKRAVAEAEQKGDAAKLLPLRQELDDFLAKFGNYGKPFEFSGSLRRSMRREAEMLFAHLLKENGSVLELIDNPYTYLNQELAEHYGVPGVKGGEMQWVKLPPESPRGGVLTMGTVLAVTSNPTRTSPVKRGMFILDNILGTPPPPPPPNIPSLEASEKNHDGSERPLREALAMHRENPQCSSCHNRMDPLGLALENFNATGRWRDQELGLPLEPPSGKLITGEEFADVKELKRILVSSRRLDYYRCLAEKLLTYSLGRGPQPCDIPTVDTLVDELDRSGGKFSTLIRGVIDSPPFQRRQRTTP